MTFTERFHEIRTGFERPFWVANISELFERLSYYAVFAVLARYLHEGLHFDLQRASSLTGMFGGLGLVSRGDWRGGGGPTGIPPRPIARIPVFELRLLLAGIDWGGLVRAAAQRGATRNPGGLVLVLPALGVALVKPSVVGTTARASKENVRSIGYSIYYTLVNVGSTAGPYLASWVHKHIAAWKMFSAWPR